MIIIKLKDGLGNQLFQYCFAKSLAQRLNKELFIDISSFKHGLSRHIVYGLHPFNIKGVVGNYPYININTPMKPFYNLIYLFKNSIVRKINVLNILCKYLENNSSNTINFNFEEPPVFKSSLIIDDKLYDFTSINTPAYFEGYFQFYADSKNRLFITERFFKDYNQSIHEDLKYLPKLTDKSKKIIEDMESSNSVLLHVRHGDYKGLLDFGLCSSKYYENSIEIMASKVDNPKFFIFSDDIEGAKNNLKIKYPHVFIDFEENNDLIGRGNGELLKLMSSCKHFIIANSTLSWWAAFLSNNKHKLIISPQPWFQSRRIMGVETIDNKVPISVVNNHADIFNKSEKLIYKLNTNDFIFKNINFEKIDDVYKITNLQMDSNITLKKNNNKQRFIMKISLESNCFNIFKILFKTKDNNKYCDENTFNVYYYDNDDFEHYLIFPKDAILDDLKIKPGNPFNNKQDYIIIKSLEIKEMNEGN